MAWCRARVRPLAYLMTTATVSVFIVMGLTFALVFAPSSQVREDLALDTPNRCSLSDSTSLTATWNLNLWFLTRLSLGQRCETLA